MNDYLYDGSFTGLLTAVYQAYYHPVKPDSIMPQSSYNPGLFANPIFIAADSEKADKVYHAIINKISPAALRHVYRAYLSELPGIENTIYHYLRIGFKLGKQVNSHLTNQYVSKIHNVSRKVSSESHRMLGLIRFQLIAGDIYYAPIEPDYNIVGLVAPHFAKRLAGQKWVIHDVKRNSAALHNGEEWVLTDLNSESNFTAQEKEAFYQNLWRDYFKNAGVPDRKNPKLQRQFMPARYWKHLTEMK